MGVIYKVKPEVRDFILEHKNKNPALSCRKLTALVLDNFKVELSKSSINSIIKEAGLSAPVGRTPKKKRRHIAMPPLPVIVNPPALPVLSEDASHRERSEAIPETEIASVAALPRNDNEEERIKAEEEAAKRAEAEKWARLAEEERLIKEAREKTRIEEEQKQEEIRKAREEEEKIKLAKLEEEKRKAEEDAAKRAEAEKWAKIAEEEKKKKEEEKASLALSIDKIYQLEDNGIILLRAADSIIGASKLIAASVKSRLPQDEGNFEDLVENLIYLPLLQGKISQIAADNLANYLEKVENIKVMNLDISRIISSSLQEARCVKAILSDGANLYFDASMYSVWSSPHIPYDFSSPLNNLKKRINKYFNEGSPVVIFNAPGYDMPSQEFFNFLGALDGKGNSITNLVIYGNKFEELEVLPIALSPKRNFVFGVWPWQFTECRKVKSLGEFRRFRLEEQERDIFIADIEIELRHPNTGRQMSFNGCVIKLSLLEKTRLVILSNFTPAMKKSEDLAAIYFNHWPNLEEAFQDYSRKIELFTYTANSQKYFSAENINLGLGEVTSISELFRAYLSALDAYTRWHLLPAGYEEKDFVVTKERFYNLIVEPKSKKESFLANFVLPPGYIFDKDLSYLCRRINEKEVSLSSGQKLFLKPD